MNVYSKFLEYKNKKMRFYVNEETEIHYPSVTTILDWSANKDWYTECVNAVGEEKAKQDSLAGTSRGTIFHDMIERYLKTRKNPAEIIKETVLIDDITNETFYKEAGELLCKFVNSGISDLIFSVLSTEQPIHHWTKYGGYGGRYDMIATDMFGQNILIDFKTSSSPKDEDNIHDYQLQLVAYWHAISKNYNIPIHTACNIIVNKKTDNAQIIYVDKNKAKTLLPEFFKKIDIYYNEVLTNIEGKWKPDTI